MGAAALLFNGIHYNFTMVERAVAWAIQSKGNLVCLFLRAEKETAEGYIFPSDLDEAENINSTEDASASHAAIIDSNVRMLEHVLHSKGIAFTTTILTEPAATELAEKLKGCELVFVSDKLNEPGILTVTSIDLKNWINDSEIPVENIKS